MNTRILRMCVRSELNRDTTRLVDALGQLQPVIFCRARDGSIQFRAEDVADRYGELRPCISVLNFRHHKPQIRKLFAELEHHHAAGTETPAAKLWREYQEQRAIAAQAAAAPPIQVTPAVEGIQFDLFGQPVNQPGGGRKKGH